MRTVVIAAAVCAMVVLTGCRREVEHQPLKLGAYSEPVQTATQK